MGWDYYSTITMPCSKDELLSVFLLTKRYVERIEEFHFFEEYREGYFVGCRVTIASSQYKGKFESIGFLDLLNSLTKLFPEKVFHISESSSQSFVTHLLIGEHEMIEIYEDDMGHGEINFIGQSKYDFCWGENESIHIYDRNRDAEVACLDYDVVGLIKTRFLNEPSVDKMKDLIMNKKGEVAASPELSTFPQP